MQIVKTDVNDFICSTEELEAAVRAAFGKKAGKDINFCVFDIETTGLSPQVSNIYVIGLLEIKKDKGRSEDAHDNPATVKITQLFADDYVSEKQLLDAFFDYVKDFDVLISYNAEKFDIPFIEKKCLFWGIHSLSDNIQCIDIQSILKCEKEIFGTNDAKLSTMEKMADFSRSDRLSGKKCIDIYVDYMIKKYFRDDEAKERDLHLLLKHNCDDLLGTLHTLKLLPYARLVEGDTAYSFVSGCAACSGISGGEDSGFDDYIVIDNKRTVGRYPVSLEYEQNGVRMSFFDNVFRLTLPIVYGTKYHYFSDYKNYYYLPGEDMAVHKSVGEYVDKEYRERATKKNCYIKKSGRFIPVPHCDGIDGMILFCDRDDMGGRGYILLENELNEELVFLIVKMWMA